MPDLDDNDYANMFDETEESPATAATANDDAAELNRELAVLRPGEAEIAALGHEYMQIQVLGPDDEEGAEQAHQALQVMVKMRTGLNAARLAKTKKWREWTTDMNEECKRLVGLMDPIEKHLRAQRAIVEDEKKRRVEEAKAKADAERKQRLDNRMLEITCYRTDLAPSIIGALDDDGYAQLLTESKLLYQKRQEREAKEAEERRLEAERLREQREENERLRKEQEARDADARRKLDEERSAFTRRMADEEADRKAKHAAEVEKWEEEARRRREQLKREGEDLEQRQAALRDEQIKIDEANAKREFERQAEIEKAQREKADRDEQARVAALAPVRVNLIAAAETVRLLPLDNLYGSYYERARMILNDAADSIEGLGK